MNERDQPTHEVFFGSFIYDSNTGSDFRFEGMLSNNERRHEDEPTPMVEPEAEPMPQHNNFPPTSQNTTTNLTETNHRTAMRTKPKTTHGRMVTMREREKEMTRMRKAETEREIEARKEEMMLITRQKEKRNKETRRKTSRRSRCPTPQTSHRPAS